MNRIRAARQARGWTQNELADRAGVSPRTIHAVEKGQPCRQATKRRILGALMRAVGDAARLLPRAAHRPPAARPAIREVAARIAPPAPGSLRAAPRVSPAAARMCV